MVEHFYLFNARSLVRNLSDFNLFVSLSKPALISVCETWLTDQLTDTFICPKGYTVFRKDRLRRGGGVAIFVRGDIHAERVSIVFDKADVDIACIDLTFENQKIRVTVCYRPPYYTTDDIYYLDSLVTILSNLCMTAQQNIVLGDFNLPSINWSHYTAPNEVCYDKFINFVNNVGLQQCVNTPTHENNVLDIILTDNAYLISDVNVECPIGNSDHHTVHFSVNIDNSHVPSDDYVCYYDYKNADYDHLNAYMSRINWDYEFSFVFTTEEYWNIFLAHFNTAIDLFVPLVKRKHNVCKNRKSYPRYLRKMFNRKALLWKRWRTSNMSQDKQAYKNYVSKCNVALSTYLQSKENDIISSSNAGKFYRYVNSKLGSTRTVQPVKVNTNENKLTSNPVEQANVFNDYFATVFTVDNGILPYVSPRTNDDISCDSILFTVDNVCKALLTLKPSTSSGPDGLPNVLLRKLAFSICNPLQYIFDSSIKTHQLPSLWLQAFVTPIFKKGATSEPSNYRPISLTCTCCRVMERIINAQIIDYLLSNNLITKHQHGFLRKHSTCSNLLETVNDWTLALDNHLKTDVIYIDFQKAFDSVSHPKLLSKLASYNIRGDLFAWIAAFLNNRSQQVKINNCLSNIIYITSGVPQGSVVGPTLFLLYINDLADGFANLNCAIKLYADDAKLYSSYKLGDCSPTLVKALEHLTEWAEVWQLRIANSKCVAHRISTTATPPDVCCYAIDDFKLQWSDCTRDLGVFMDNNLKFVQHISKIVHLAHTRSVLILKSFITHDPVVLVKAFCTYVRPVLEYCTPVWSPHHTGLINKIENVQRRFTKKICGLSCLCYKDRLISLKLDSLYTRRIKQDLIMCYKIINNLICLDYSDFFTTAVSDRTRGHNHKLYIKNCRLDICKFSFARRVCHLWNNLPHDVVNASSVESFKRRLVALNFDL